MTLGISRGSDGPAAAGGPWSRSFSDEAEGERFVALTAVSRNEEERRKTGAGAIEISAGRADGAPLPIGWPRLVLSSSFTPGATTTAEPRLSPARRARATVVQREGSFATPRAGWPNRLPPPGDLDAHGTGSIAGRLARRLRSGSRLVVGGRGVGRPSCHLRLVPSGRTLSRRKRGVIRAAESVFGALQSPENGRRLVGHDKGQIVGLEHP